MRSQIKIKDVSRWLGLRRRKITRHRRSTQNYLETKKKARALVIARLDYYNTHYGFKWNRIAIKNTKRRWGSCSKKGNLNFCYKVALLPQDLADYVIVHELCHLGQFNHSQAFWALVAKTVPDYKNKRSKLKNVRLTS